MSRGILLYAHNSRDLDYLQMAMVAGGLAKKNLNLPVSIISDEPTIAWAKESGNYKKCQDIFDKIIIIERPITSNKRRLHDGENSSTVPFINTSRTMAWDHTPYDQTLMIDSDYFIFTDTLNNYWDIEEDIKISSAINDIYDGHRLGYHDLYIADTGIRLYWATTVMFNKTKTSKLFFELVEMIRSNYMLFADMYRYDTMQYRNDIAFSIAKHIFDGYQTNLKTSLPPVLSAIDKDELIEISKTKLTFLIQQPSTDLIAASTENADIHIMNKQSITRNIETLMELI